MADWMPWVIMAVVVFISLTALAVAVIVLARRLAELSTRKPFYLLEVEKGAQGVRQVVRMEPDTQPDEGVTRSDEPPQETLTNMQDDSVDPNEFVLDTRDDAG